MGLSLTQIMIAFRSRQSARVTKSAFELITMVTITVVKRLLTVGVLTFALSGCGKTTSGNGAGNGNQTPATPGQTPATPGGPKPAKPATPPTPKSKFVNFNCQSNKQDEFDDECLASIEPNVKGTWSADTITEITEKVKNMAGTRNQKVTKTTSVTLALTDKSLNDEVAKTITAITDYIDGLSEVTSKEQITEDALKKIHIATRKKLADFLADPRMLTITPGNIPAELKGVCTFLQQFKEGRTAVANDAFKAKFPVIDFKTGLVDQAITDHLPKCSAVVVKSTWVKALLDITECQTAVEQESLNPLIPVLDECRAEVKTFYAYIDDNVYKKKDDQAGLDAVKLILRSPPADITGVQDLFQAPSGITPQPKVVGNVVAAARYKAYNMKIEGKALPNTDMFTAEEFLNVLTYEGTNKYSFRSRIINKEVGGKDQDITWENVAFVLPVEEMDKEPQAKDIKLTLAELDKIGNTITEKVPVDLATAHAKAAPLLKPGAGEQFKSKTNVGSTIQVVEFGAIQVKKQRFDVTFHTAGKNKKMYFTLSGKSDGRVFYTSAILDNKDTGKSLEWSADVPLPDGVTEMNIGFFIDKTGEVKKNDVVELTFENDKMEMKKDGKVDPKTEDKILADPIAIEITNGVFDHNKAAPAGITDAEIAEIEVHIKPIITTQPSSTTTDLIMTMLQNKNVDIQTFMPLTSSSGVHGFLVLAVFLVVGARLAWKSKSHVPGPEEIDLTTKLHSCP